MELGRLNEAEKHLLKALKLDPTYRFALISMANLKRVSGRIEEAWRTLSSVADTYLEGSFRSNFEELNYLLRSLHMLAEAASGKLRREAEEAFEKLLMNLPSEAPPNLLLKVALGLKKDAEKWRQQELEKRLRMRSAPINPNEPLTRILSLYRKYALVRIGKALKIKPSPEALKKAELVRKVVARLQDREFLAGVVASLNPNEKAALFDLMRNDGLMQWTEFSEKYVSDLDESIYWDYHQPKTIMGRLRARGLIIEGAFNGMEWILIPKELKPLLAATQRQEDAERP
jgi:tetratricopeptide (TPR) repeat protein